MVPSIELNSARNSIVEGPSIELIIVLKPVRCKILRFRYISSPTTKSRPGRRETETGKIKETQRRQIASQPDLRLRV